MERAQQQAVAEAGRPALAPRHDVVHVARGGRHIAAGGGAVPVPGDDGAAQVRRDQVGDGADVQGQADRPGGPGQRPGAEPGREAAGPGEQGDGLAQDDLAGGCPGQVLPLQPPLLSVLALLSVRGLLGRALVGVAGICRPVGVAAAVRPAQPGMPLVPQPARAGS